jgi:hypothetical protein
MLLIYIEDLLKRKLPLVIHMRTAHQLIQIMKTKTVLMKRLILVSLNNFLVIGMKGIH